MSESIVPAQSPPRLRLGRLKTLNSSRVCAECKAVIFAGKRAHVSVNPAAARHPECVRRVYYGGEQVTR